MQQGCPPGPPPRRGRACTCRARSRSPTARAGNYLAAIVAGADHDTTAAATFSREALRFDPRNPQLIERAFVSALANGNMLDSFTLADRLLAKQPTDGLAHLVLGVKALKSHQWAQARTQLAKDGPSPSRDVLAALLTSLVLGRQRRREEGDRILRSPHGR